MATHTRLDDAAMAELATLFALGEVVSWQPIEAGTINSNFALTTSSGRYFLRINEGKQAAEVAYEAELVTALAAAGVPTPVSPLPGATTHRSTVASRSIRIRAFSRQENLPTGSNSVMTNSPTASMIPICRAPI